jgi:Zn-dependent protease with chaperone function
LIITLLLVLVVIALTATATVCLSAVFVVAFIAIAYWKNRAHHQALVARAYRITAQRTPGLAAIAKDCINRLQPKDIEVFVGPGQSLNAYTFGILPPRVVVLNAPLLEVMDADEMRFVLGHELGHVRLGHTWLNSLVGGMAGIPSPIGAAALLTGAFLWWNRACEYSADRAGMLACGKPRKAVSALVKLVAGPEVRTRADLQRALAVIEAEDDNAIGYLNQALATHPMMVKRIEKLQQYAATHEYRHLQVLVDGNLR